MNVRNKGTQFYILVIALPSVFVILSLIVIYAIKGYLNFKDLNFDALSAFGTFLSGFLGTILTIIATILIYRTYIMQDEQLKSQNLELELQRKLITQQQFESTFFNMLNVHRDLKNNLYINNLGKIIHNDYKDKISDIKGVRIFNILSRDFIKIIEYNENLRSSILIFNHVEFYNYFQSENKNLPEAIKIKNRLELFLLHHRNEFFHYYRNVYHILKFIKNCYVNDIKNKHYPDHSYKKYKGYVDIFQSQFSFVELVFIFYLCFNDENLRLLVKEFNFLDKLNSIHLIKKEHKDLIDVGLMNDSDLIINNESEKSEIRFQIK